MSFLKAEWRKLLMVNYEINPDVLRPYVPMGTELDTWQGRHYVSLVGFLFLNTRLLGIPIPFHRNFEEVNLRFYVKHQAGDTWKRGVVFIKEIVPKPALSWVANTVYREHYITCPMHHRIQTEQDKLHVDYFWKYRGQEQSMQAIASTSSQSIAPGSEEEFITEHYWGYSRASPQKTFEYEVTHPTWEHYPVSNYTVQVDFDKVYGPDFTFLNKATPQSVLLAEGSLITVENKRKL